MYRDPCPARGIARSGGLCGCRRYVRAKPATVGADFASVMFSAGAVSPQALVDQCALVGPQRREPVGIVVQRFDAYGPLRRWATLLGQHVSRPVRGVHDRIERKQIASPTNNDRPYAAVTATHSDSSAHSFSCVPEIASMAMRVRRQAGSSPRSAASEQQCAIGERNDATQESEQRYRRTGCSRNEQPRASRAADASSRDPARG